MSTARITCIVALLLLFSSAALGADSLTKAYQKEFSFLQAEKKALENRIKGIKSDRKRRAAAANREITALQDALLAEQETIASLEDKLSKREGADEQADEDRLRIIETLKRANDRLRQESLDTVELPDDEAEAIEWGTAIRGIFKEAGTLLQRSRSIRKSNGTFFDGEGNSVEGTIVHFGHVSRYAVSNTTSGALAPAGSGTWKLWPDGNPAHAQDLNAGNIPREGLQVFLFDSPEKAVEPKIEKTPLMIVESGGVIAWVIVWLGAFAMVLALLRVLLLLWHTTGSNRQIKRLATCLQDNDIQKAGQVTGGKRLSMNNVLRSILGHLDGDREDLENRISEAILLETPKLTRFGSAMTVIAAVAPLLGLLGTVTGMISTFDVITEHGTGDPRMLSGGISEALITTELGLIVAIPTLILGALLSGWAQQSLSNLERGALHAINCRPLTPQEVEQKEAA